MDRREKIREYKKTPRSMGVYRVRNTATGKSLIGSSVNLPAILNRQRFQLQNGLHPNRVLQEDWNELGPETFEFETLDTLEPPDEPDYDPTEDLRVLTALWLEKLSLSAEDLYNEESKRGT